MEKGKYNLWEKIKNKKDWLPAIVIYFLMVLVILVISPEGIFKFGKEFDRNTLSILSLSQLSSYIVNDYGRFFVYGYYPGLLGSILVMIVTPLRSYWKISLLSLWILLSTAGNFAEPYALASAVGDEIISPPYVAILIIVLGSLETVLIPLLSIFIIKKIIYKR